MHSPTNMTAAVNPPIEGHSPDLEQNMTSSDTTHRTVKINGRGRRGPQRKGKEVPIVQDISASLGNRCG